MGNDDSDRSEDIEKTGISAVFEYTQGSHKEGRYIVFYPSQQEVDKAKQELADDPDTNVKIVATGLSLAESQNLCDEALTPELCANILADTDPEIRIFKAMNLALALAHKQSREE